jgi:hypothetical protein
MTNLTDFNGCGNEFKDLICGMPYFFGLCLCQTCKAKIKAKAEVYKEMKEFLKEEKDINMRDGLISWIGEQKLKEINTYLQKAEELK